MVSVGQYEKLEWTEGGKAHLIPISQHLNSGEIQIGNRIMRRHGVNAPTQVCTMATWGVTSLGTEGSPLLSVKDSNTGRRRREDREV